MMDMWLFSESKLRTKFDTIAPSHIPALSNSIYIFKEYPTKNNGGFNGSDGTTAVDFSKATNNIKENKIIACTINTLYLKKGVNESLLIDSSLGGADSIIRSSPSAQTIQEFEQKGYEKWKKEESSNFVSKVNFIDPDTNTILYSALNSRQYN